MIRELCKWKEVNLIEGEVCLDHVHILVEIPPKLSVSSFMGFLKGKTSIMIYQKYGNRKHEVGANQACLNLLACRPTKCRSDCKEQEAQSGWDVGLPNITSLLPHKVPKRKQGLGHGSLLAMTSE